MTYNVQPLRTENEIDLLFGLRRKKDIVHSHNPTIVEQEKRKEMALLFE